MAAQNLLLLPGMMCDERVWRAQAAHIDIPISYADTTQADNFADMAAAVLEEAPQQFAMAGLSMGGILAFEILRQAPQRVTHLALLDTNPHAETPERQSMRLEQIKEATAGRLRQLAIEALKPLYLAEAHRNDPELLDTILDMALDLGPDVFHRQSLALRDRCDSVPALPSICCPTLVMCGDEDLLCPVGYHELMAEKIPHARLRIIEQCGHMSPLEQPQEVTQALQALLAE
jgi:pimeloyl-ACP methyl ester carboxylesterase